MSRSLFFLLIKSKHLTKRRLLFCGATNYNSLSFSSEKNYLVTDMRQYNAISSPIAVIFTQN
jgi:hypothetical protein